MLRLLRRLFGARASSTTVVRDVSPQQTLPTGGCVNVVGESHYQRQLVSLAGGKREESARIETTAELVREPENPYDTEAIAVLIGGQHVGYLSRQNARKYKAVVNETVKNYERATCHATIVGGWNRGNGDEGHFGVRLWMSDRERAHPGPQSGECRIPSGTRVSVSHEEHYQHVLLDAVRGRDLDSPFPVVATLRVAERDPHRKKVTTEVLEVLVGGETVGFLTEAMTQRYAPYVSSSVESGRIPTAEAWITDSRKKGFDAEIWLRMEEPQ